MTTFLAQNGQVLWVTKSGPVRLTDSSVEWLLKTWGEQGEESLVGGLQAAAKQAAEQEKRKKVS